MTRSPLEISDLSSSSHDEYHDEKRPHQDDSNHRDATRAATAPMNGYSRNRVDDDAEPSGSFVAIDEDEDQEEEFEEDPPSSQEVESPDGTSRLMHHDHDDDHKTTVWQTFVHLVKGYIGPGCLSLPWAMSQLGIVPGVVLCFLLAAWSSYNCWIVVDLKRQLMTNSSSGVGNGATNRSNDSTHNVHGHGGGVRRQLTYPDVAGCMYGPRAQTITAMSIGTQQLAICTVFFSFAGDNLKAVLDGLYQSHVDENHDGFSHIEVISFCFPIVLALAMIPDLKALAPAMTLATALLLVGFAIIGLLVLQEWDERPGFIQSTGFPYFITASVAQYPMAVCALLYSYEGICLILPIESAMRAPQHFGWTFTIAMFLAASTYSAVAAIAVYVFGAVKDGSLTAFLLERYEKVGAQEELVALLLVANAAVSVSVLITFPLQLFPALELIQEYLDGAAGRRRQRFAPLQTEELADAEDDADGDISHTLDDANDLSLREHRDADELWRMDSSLNSDRHNECNGDKSDEEIANLALSMDTESNGAEVFSDEPGLEDDTGNDPSPAASTGSIWLRFALVIFTYLIAIVVPNVQSLIALAGALAGSLTALILPPALAMANGGRGLCGLSLAVGILFGSIGTAASLRGIWKSMDSANGAG